MMICNAKLSNSSLAPAKLREHLLKLHGDGECKNTTLAEFKVRRARFDEKATLPALGFVPINKPILTASYEVAYLIAKQGRPHTIGETLIKPAALKMANLILGTAAKKTYTYVLNLEKKSHFISVKKGSANAHLKLVEFGTSNKAENHWSRSMLKYVKGLCKKPKDTAAA